MTYGGQGTLKKGVHAESHAVVYTSKTPVMKPGEKITKKSIRMDPFSPRDKLDATSRINYAKLYTVEHNVKVHFVGKVVEKHEQRVVTDYNGTHSPLTYRPYVPVNEEDSMYAEVVIDKHEQRVITDYNVTQLLAHRPSVSAVEEDPKCSHREDPQGYEYPNHLKNSSIHGTESGDIQILDKKRTIHAARYLRMI